MCCKLTSVSSVQDLKTKGILCDESVSLPDTFNATDEEVGRRKYNRCYVRYNNYKLVTYGNTYQKIRQLFNEYSSRAAFYVFWLTSKDDSTNFLAFMFLKLFRVRTKEFTIFNATMSSTTWRITYNLSLMIKTFFHGKLLCYSRWKMSCFVMHLSLLLTIVTTVDRVTI